MPVARRAGRNLRLRRRPCSQRQAPAFARGYGEPGVRLPSKFEFECRRNAGEGAAGLSNPNGAIGRSDIEGKAARVAASERGQRTSLKQIEIFE
jgi:hypothetical protein